MIDGVSETFSIFYLGFEENPREKKSTPTAS